MSGFLEVGRSAGLDGLKLRRYTRFMHFAFPYESKRLRKTGQSWLALDWARKFGADLEYVSADTPRFFALRSIDGKYSAQVEEFQRKKHSPVRVF